MGVRLGGIGAGLAAGLQNATGTMINLAELENRDRRARTEEELAKGRLDLLGRQATLAEAAGTREQEKWDITKAEEGRANRLIPISSIEQMIPIKEAVPYMKNIAAGMGLIEKDTAGNEVIRAKDIAKVRAALNDPIHATQLSNIEIGHWETELATAQDALSKAEGAGQTENLAPLLAPVANAKSALQAAKGRNAGLMAWIKEEGEKEKRLTEKEKLNIERVKAEKPDKWSLALKAADGDAKKAMDLITEQDTAPEKIRAKETERYHRELTENRKSENEARDEARKERAAAGYISQINTIDTTIAKLRRGVDPVTDEMMTQEQKAGIKADLDALVNNRKRIEGILREQYPDQIKGFLEPEGVKKPGLGGQLSPSHKEPTPTAGPVTPKRAPAGREISFRIAEEPERFQGPTVSGAEEPVYVPPEEARTAFGQSTLSSILPKSSLARLGGQAPRYKVVKGREPVRLDRETAAQFLRAAGGDKEKARQMAIQAGYSL